MRALRSLLADWPASIPAAVLVVQHPGNGGGRFAEVLDHSTELEVVALRGARENRVRLAIDPLFREAVAGSGRSAAGTTVTRVEDPTV